MVPTPLEALTDALQLSDGFELHFAIVPNAGREDAIVEHLQRMAESIGLATQELCASDAHDSSSSPPFESLLMATPAPRLSMLRTLQASREDVQALERCFLQINPRRDAIARRHVGPLLVVCRPDGLRRIADIAPDFYSVHTGLWVLEAPAWESPQPVWMLFDHEAIGLLGLDSSFRVYDGQAIPSFRLPPPVPLDMAATHEAESAALATHLLDESTRVRVAGPPGSELSCWVAEVLRTTPRNFDAVIWLDGEAVVSPPTLLHGLVRSLASDVTRPPVDPRDLERAYRRLTARRPVLILIDGASSGSRFPAPSRPSKLIELVSSAEGVDADLYVHAMSSEPVGTARAELGDEHERRERWRWTRGLLDADLPTPRVEAAERRAREASLEDVEAGAAVCAPTDGARFFAAVARSVSSPIEAGRYWSLAIERALCVRTDVELFESWLRALERIDEYRAQAVRLRFMVALRMDTDRAAALFRWEQLAPIPVDASVLAMVRRVILRDPGDSEDGKHSDPRVDFVARLRHLASCEVDELLVATETMRSRWADSAAIVEHFGASGCCWIHLDHSRWEHARLALERAELGADAWGDPYALLRARLLGFRYHVARGDIESAAEPLEGLCVRAEELLGPLHPATMGLLAEGVDVYTAAARPGQARALADEVWRRLDYFNFNVNHASRPMLVGLLRWFREHGGEDRVAQIERRWAWVLAGAGER